MSPSSAPRVTIDLAAGRAGDADDVVAERRASAGSARRRAAARGRGRRPASEPAENASVGQYDRAHDAVDELDGRARRLEVDVLLGVERRERARVASRARASAPRRSRRRRRRSSPRTRRSSRAGATSVPRSSERSPRSPYGAYRPCTTGLRSVPTPSIVISTTSPSTSQRGGVRAAPTPAGCAGEDHVAGLERAALADPRDEVRHREHELRRVRRLQHLAAHARLDREPGREVDLVERHDLGPERAERVERLRPAPLAGRVLMIARRHVVRDRDARDDVERVVVATSRARRPITTASSPS